MHPSRRILVVLSEALMKCLGRRALPHNEKDLLVLKGHRYVAALRKPADNAARMPVH